MIHNAYLPKPKSSGAKVGKSKILLFVLRFKPEKNVGLKAEVGSLQYNMHFICSGGNAAK